MSKEIIKSIELNIGEVTVKVTQKQANDLYEALASLLGKPTMTWNVYPHTWQVPSQTITSNGAGNAPIAPAITIY